MIFKNKDGLYALLSKSSCHLGQQREFDKSQIPVLEETKFLGIYLDRKLFFMPHLRYVKKKRINTLIILKVISHTEWGADQEIMLRFYRSLVRSKLDYGCIVYGSARKSYLQTFDAHETSLEVRHTKLSL